MILNDAVCHSVVINVSQGQNFKLRLGMVSFSEIKEVLLKILLKY